MNSQVSLTHLIRMAVTGDPAAWGHVFDATYADLRALARMRLAATPRGALLDTTSLVHESFLRFANAGRLEVSDRNHFFRYAATVMRSVIVDLARQQLADRRGGNARHITLNTQIGEDACAGEQEILRVHEALEELGKLDPRLAQIVEMRYFAGMTEQEMADVLGVTDRTIRRGWEKARVLLAAALRNP